MAPSVPGAGRRGEKGQCPLGGPPSGGRRPRLDVPSPSTRRHAAALAAAASPDPVARPPAPGRLVETARGGGGALALVVSADGKKNWAALAATGARVSLKPADITAVLPGDGHDEAALAEAAAVAAAAPAADGGLLEDAWECLGPDAADPMTAEAVSELLYGGSGAPAVAAALRLLAAPAGRALFKPASRRPPLWTRRPEAEAVAIRAQMAAEAAAAAAVDEAVVALRAAAAAPPADAPDAAAWAAGPHARFIDALNELAMERADGKAAAVAVGVLRALGAPPTADGAAALLSSVGARPRLELPSLRRAGLTDDFDPELEAAAAALAAAPPADADAAARLDLTSSHAVFTIDDASTTEIDDGLSIERDAHGAAVALWVHVADPGAHVPPLTPLAREAARRSRTLYLPTGSVPMFPRALSDGAFSLRAGVAGPALSVRVPLGADGGPARADATLHLTRIAPARRLTYDDVDASLEAGTDPDAAAAAAFAAARGAARAAAGAALFDLPEAMVSVTVDAQGAPVVSVKQIYQEATGARAAVAEAMIAANEAVALFGAAAALPLPYRGQPPPTPLTDADLADIPAGVCESAARRQRMERSTLATDAPAPHAGLGLAAYVQATSPIRRYGDLVAHWQVKAALAGRAPPWRDAPALAAHMADAADAARELNQAERKATNYWLTRYFQAAVDAAKKGRAPPPEWTATVLLWVRADAGVARVLVDGLGIEAVVRLARPTRLGESVSLSFSGADDRGGPSFAQVGGAVVTDDEEEEEEEGEAGEEEE